MLLSPILLLGFQLIFFSFSFFSMQVLWSFVMVSTLDSIRRFWWLSSCGLVMYAGNHDLLCQVGNLNAKNGIESLLNSITSPPQCSPTHAGRIKRQYHKWQCEQHEERRVLHKRKFENGEEVEKPIWQKTIWESWGREPLLWIFHPRLCPRKLSRRLFKEMLMRSTAPAQKNL